MVPIIGFFMIIFIYFLSSLLTIGCPSIIWFSTAHVEIRLIRSASLAAWQFSIAAEILHRRLEGGQFFGVGTWESLEEIERGG